MERAVRRRQTAFCIQKTPKVRASEAPGRRAPEARGAEPEAEARGTRGSRAEREGEAAGGRPRGRGARPPADMAHAPAHGPWWRMGA